MSVQPVVLHDLLMLVIDEFVDELGIITGSIDIPSLFNRSFISVGFGLCFWSIAVDVCKVAKSVQISA